MTWLERTAANIFPLSQEKRDLNKALREWEYRGYRRDAGHAEEICRLCDHENIRYQFQIVNTGNNNTLLIGSKCILKYSDIGVVDEAGVRLTKANAEKKVNRDARALVAQTQKDSVLNSLIKLSRAPGNKIDFEEMFRKYEEDGAFTPKELFAALYRLDVTRTPYTKKYFKMRLRKIEYKQQIAQMELRRIGRIWDCLTTNQKEVVRKLRSDIPRNAQWS